MEPLTYESKSLTNMINPTALCFSECNKVKLQLHKNEMKFPYNKKAKVALNCSPEVFKNYNYLEQLTNVLKKVPIITGRERTVHMSRCPALYSGCIFVPLCR